MKSSRVQSILTGSAGGDDRKEGNPDPQQDSAYTDRAEALGLPVHRRSEPRSQRAGQAAPVSRWLFAGLLLFVIIPFLFWRMTWFGGRLSDEEFGRYLQDTSVPHKTQHA